MIKRLREGGKMINDDFGLNYLPGQADINRTDLEIGKANPNRSTFLPDTSLEETKQTDDDDFNLGMRQFTSFNKKHMDTNRSRTDGNLLHDLYAEASVNSDGKKVRPRNLIHKTMTPKSTDHAHRLEQQIITEH